MRLRCWEIGLRSPEARKRSRSSQMDPSPAARIRAARVRPLGINRGLVAAVAILCAAVLGACEPGPPPAEPIARQYAAAWQKSDYQAMWDLLTDDAKAQVTPAGFTERLPRIADEMTLTSLEAKPGTATHPALPNGSPDPRKASVPLDLIFHTQRVGDIARATTLQLVMVGEKDKAVWRIAWTPEAILPHLTAGRLVRMTRLPTSRGRIVARDGTGLAATLDDELGGSYGFRLGIVESDERPVETLAETAPVPGRDVVLSLDPKLQRVAENALGNNKGAIVAEDPWSGEILALASRPTFDLNALVSGDAAAIARYTSDPNRPFFNRATFGQYPTGSSFKPITSAAALRNGVYSWGDRIDCPARWTGYGEQWAQLNHETVALGPIDLRTALARSCNTFFYEIGKRLNDRDPNILPNTAKSFGLGKATDIDFVYEAEGIIPSPDWKKQHFTNPADQVWNPGDATNLAIGQGFLLATPLQMANYTSTVANDGILWKPRLVIELRDRDGKTVKAYPKTQVGSALTIPTDLSLIRDGMHAVTTDADGTVSFVFHRYSPTTAGKSGTAESPAQGKVDAWFIGWASFEQPSIAIAAVLDEYTERPGVFGSVDSAIAVKAVLTAKFATP